ncbi:MAG TPA: type I secretion system permease/ATPase [Rhizomicrobium sp.]|jgi:PrtD family type I secretion system ABC transporter|nr:type I secretion system permease/ATPase [Rhizomicrobium sp.]
MSSAGHTATGVTPPDPVRAALAACKPLFGAAFAFSAAMSVLALTTSFYMLQVYDRVLASRSSDTLLLLTVIAVVAIGVFAALDSLRMRLLQRIGLRVGEMLSGKVLRAMVATSSQNGGVTLRSGLRDVDTIRGFVGSPGFAALIDAPFIVVYMLVLFLLSPFFLLIVVIGGAILVAIAAANQRLTNPPLSRSIQLSMRAQTFADDGLRNADVLEGMGMSHTFVARWRQSWLEALAIGTAASDRDSRLSSISRGVRLLIQIFLLGAGALLILDFQATGGIMIGASIIGARALAPIEAIVGSWKSVIAVRLAWTRLVTLLGQAPKRDEGMKLPEPSGQIQVLGLSYVVPGTRRTILSNLSFELSAGETLGIIGPSASGKSTLLRLMVGAWPCSGGTVRLDGANIYEWPRAELSRHIGYLPQDVELFAGSVRENIARLGEGDPDTVVRAAKRAGAHEMILSLPKDYNTDIGDYGHKLSGGQSQRIGIARTLYGEPRYVVLDEPNSNLDGAGEDALLATLADLKADRVTVVIVAHRPSILQNVDKLLVLRANGTVEAFGPRAEIMQKFAARGAQRAPANVVPMTPAGDGGPGRSGIPS